MPCGIGPTVLVWQRRRSRSCWPCWTSLGTSETSSPQLPSIPKSKPCIATHHAYYTMYMYMYIYWMAAHTLLQQPNCCFFDQDFTSYCCDIACTLSSHSAFSPPSSIVTMATMDATHVHNNLIIYHVHVQEISLVAKVILHSCNTCLDNSWYFTLSYGLITRLHS